VNLRLAEVRRLLDRYLVEIVETYDLCPWARTARLSGELAIDVLWGTPTIEAWTASSAELLARPETRVAMVVAPELDATPAELRVIRDRVAKTITTAGIAHFHPAAPLDDATPARLVPYLRRSPDPLLQLVPLALLETVRMREPAIDRAHQIQLLNGSIAPLRGDVADRLAAVNHARVTADAAAVAACLEDIAADRLRSYTRVGIALSESR
jgi:hypothetical protein